MNDFVSCESTAESEEFLRVNVAASIARQLRIAQPTRQQKCAELAKAMGWTPVEKCGCGVMGCAKCTDEVFGLDAPPSPFTSHEACHALKVWLAADNARWASFIHCLLDILPPQTTGVADQIDLSMHAQFLRLLCEIRRIQAADPAVIAEAAWQSIQPAKQETT